MSYASEQGFRDRFGETELLQLADLDGDGTADAAIIESRIRDTDGEIDSYLGQRYSLPLSHLPDILEARAADILRYRLHDHQPPQVVRDRYDDAVSWLRRVARGEASLGLPVSDEPASDHTAVVRSREQVFTPDKLDQMP